MYRKIFFLLCLILAGTLCGCTGKSSDCPDIFSRQSSYSCSIDYTITFDAVIDGECYSGFTQHLSAEGIAAIDKALCGYVGTLETHANGDPFGNMEVEFYADAFGSYYRYGSVRYSASDGNFLRVITDFPAYIDLSSYEASQLTQSIYGTTCNVWMGTEIADESDQSFVSGMTQGNVSLDGCLIDVTLWTEEDSGLPLQVNMDYSNINALDITFFDDDGNRFTITALTIAVTYTGYGAPVDIIIPEELRTAPNVQDALGGNDDSPQIPQELLEQGVISYTGDPEADLSNAYAILNDDSSACYIIDTPYYMAADEYERDYVCFYYVYDDLDVEYISYTYFSNFTSEDELDYALKLPEYIAETESTSPVKDSGLQTTTIGGRNISYIELYYTVEEEGISYDTMEVYSWIEAPNGRDCLEVDIVEYNANGDELFVDVEEELIYAYEAILGYGVLE